jgi:hypothetical protein
MNRYLGGAESERTSVDPAMRKHSTPDLYARAAQLADTRHKTLANMMWASINDLRSRFEAADSTGGKPDLGNEAWIAPYAKAFCRDLTRYEPLMNNEKPFFEVENCQTNTHCLKNICAEARRQ